MEQALNDVLLSDEDMEKMHLSAKPAIAGRGRYGRRLGGGDHHQQQQQQQQDQYHHTNNNQDAENNNHQEVEMMLENYLMQVSKYMCLSLL